MLKRWIALTLALFSLAASALAEVCEGRTAALSTVSILAVEDGVVESVPVLAGQRVEAGQVLCGMRPQKTFSSQDGVVSLVNAASGDAVDGAVLEIMPLECYTIHCTVSKAYQSAASTLVHGGETVYLKCTADGTHRGIGIITQIDGEEYRVLAIGGELLVGETVYLYRDSAFKSASRVGIGTVVVSDTEIYEADGTLARLCVDEGDYVERGQLLYETGGGEICAPAGGIIASVSCRAGDSVAKDQVIAELVPDGAICVEAQVSDAVAARVSPGDAVRLTCAGQEEDDAVTGRIAEISGITESGLCTLRILPEGEMPPVLGLRVSVRV